MIGDLPSSLGYITGPHTKFLIYKMGSVVIAMENWYYWIFFSGELQSSHNESNYT